jgi:hypothetical protein
MYAQPPRTIFMGSYPPRQCGIATFTKDVVDSYNAAYGIGSEVVAIDEPGGESRSYPKSSPAYTPASARLIKKSPRSSTRIPRSC